MDDSDTAFSPDGFELVAGDGRRYLNLGFADVPAGASSLDGSVLETAFSDECRDKEIQGRMCRGDGEWRFEFDGQESAAADQLLMAYRDELRSAGVLVGETLRLHPLMDEGALDRARVAIAHTVGRLRTLLVEHNSYLTGGVRYPFAESLPGFSSRGLAIYRFPGDGPTTVEAVGDEVRIFFEPGDLGPITSSGFYVPFLVEGDFVLTTDYRLGLWKPEGGEAACFGLIANNESVQRRYHAQRMSTADGHEYALTDLCEVVSPVQVVEGITGSLRIVRQGAVISCFHKSDGDWIDIGSAPAPDEPEMFVGAKVWAKVRCGGLEAFVSNFRIEGTLAARQIPPVPVRPDPRSR